MIKNYKEKFGLNKDPVQINTMNQKILKNLQNQIPQHNLILDLA